MPIDGKLLEILCCPVSKTLLNEAISSGDVLYVRGDQVAETLREALITEDSKVIYPVIDGIPILLEEKGIGTTQFQDF